MKSPPNPPHEWWNPADRVVSVLSPLGGDEHMLLPADAVFCDVCGAGIPFAPVPVVSGYALCDVCFTRKYGITVDEAARREGIELAFHSPHKEK